MSAGLNNNQRLLVAKVAQWQTHRDRATEARDEALTALDRASVVADATRQVEAQRAAADFAVISRSLTEDIDRAVGHLEALGFSPDDIGTAIDEVAAA